MRSDVAIFDSSRDRTCPNLSAPMLDGRLLVSISEEHYARLSTGLAEYLTNHAKRCIVKNSIYRT